MPLVVDFSRSMAQECLTAKGQQRSVYRQIRCCGLSSCQLLLILPFTQKTWEVKITVVFKTDLEVWGIETNFVQSRFYLWVHDGGKRVRRKHSENWEIQFSLIRETNLFQKSYGMICNFISEQVSTTVPSKKLECVRLYPQSTTSKSNYNAKLHTAAVNTKFFRDSQVTVLPWAAKSTSWRNNGFE